MSLNTLIQWARHTLNFWWGCVEVSEACRDCYARELDKMRGGNFDNGNTHWGKSAPRWLRVENAVKDAERMNRLAIKEGGEKPRVFINSMSDTFEDHPALPEARRVLFATIERLTACNWLLLTKRPENIRNMVPFSWLTKWPAHVWVGTTVENQERLNERWRHLMNVPAAVTFFSAEPLLGPLNLRSIEIKLPGAGGSCFIDFTTQTGHSIGGSWPARKVDWVICGGESGSKARPFAVEWADDLLRQCQAAGVPFFMKQLGSHVRTSNANAHDWPEHVTFNEVGDDPGFAAARVGLNNRHGGDMAEFPEELRVRETPEARP